MKLQVYQGARKILDLPLKSAAMITVRMVPEKGDEENA